MLSTIIFLTCFLTSGTTITVAPGTWDVVATRPPPILAWPPAPLVSSEGKPGESPGDLTVNHVDPMTTRIQLARTVKPGETVEIPDGCLAKVTVKEQP